ncbi:DUF7344 domain-containing protein [Natronosalvus rutilus]|uniref:DUF7344 domain-containing protein n=1 Tax=Natronosalvus rutilus TaxID=2953753 RepID=A0A9E7N8E9_9EURY|nr:hypothetical protein [Natronosalvus rutilus]UTF52298.1 hypothetical protein NGM29_10900 [Natronosalvus rutilus]
MSNREKGSTARACYTAPSLDLVFELLASRRRRQALYYLSEQSDGVASVDEIADYVHTNDDRSDCSADGRSEIAAGLRHVHLPKLEDAGVVDHDARSQTVRYWSQPSLEEWLEHAYHKESVQ